MALSSFREGVRMDRLAERQWRRSRVALEGLFKTKCPNVQGQPDKAVFLHSSPGAVDLERHLRKRFEVYLRYSTALFLSRTATEEPGSAKESVALEPSSNSILNSALSS